MHLSHLITFAAVVRHGSISRAAEELHLTQPAATKHVQALEKHYGRPLLNRSGRGLEVTEEGRILYLYALQVLDLLDKTEKAVAEAGAIVQGKLTVGASTIPGQYVLPRLIRPFCQEYPGVEVRLVIADTDQIARRVREGETDVGMVGSPVTDRRLESIPFLEDELVLLVPPGHPLARQEKVTVRDLSGQPLIWREAGSGTRKTVEEALTAAGIPLAQGSVALEVGSTEAAVTAVEVGLGLSIVSRWAADRAAALGTVAVKTLEDLPLKRQLYLIYPRKKLSRAAGAWVRFLTSPYAGEYLGR